MLEAMEVDYGYRIVSLVDYKTIIKSSSCNLIGTHTFKMRYRLYVCSELHISW